MNGFELLESYYVFKSRGTAAILQQVRTLERQIDRSTRPVRQIDVNLNASRAVRSETT
ncbi:MAG: hypothetical protein R3C28_02700 [Pirellulaceae bacterium]